MEAWLIDYPRKISYINGLKTGDIYGLKVKLQCENVNKDICSPSSPLDKKNTNTCMSGGLATISHVTRKRGKCSVNVRFSAFCRQQEQKVEFSVFSPLSYHMLQRMKKERLLDMYSQKCKF